MNDKDWQIIKLVIFILFSIPLLFGCGASNTKLASGNDSAYQTKAYLLFPVKGVSFIGAGGITIEKNHHASEKDQRYALDIVALEVDSNTLSEKDIKAGNFITHDGAPKVNESYYIFGRKIISPADGKIVSVHDGVPDATPSESHYDFNNPAGNYVVIDHGYNEFSMLAHLKNGSITVRNGDKVLSGSTIGMVGNSGNSTEPHLHYHLQNTPKWRNGEGLPAQFNRYISNGKYIEKGEPIQGQIVISD